MKKRWVITGVVSALVLGAGGQFYFSRNLQRELLAPKRGRVVESIYGLGTVTADKTFEVRSGMTLAVRKVFVKEGALVKPGDALVQLDENVIRSKIEGTVTNVNYSEGELVPPQSSTVVVTNLQDLFLEVSLEQQSVLRIKTKQKSVVSFESLRSEKFEGMVTSVYPRDNQFIVRIELEKWPSGVLPGMTADVAILVGEKEDALLIPIRSIVAGQVTRVREGSKETLSVKLGAIDGEWAEVLSDNILESDQLVGRK